jgi:hypothetical protein
MRILRVGSLALVILAACVPAGNRSQGSAVFRSAAQLGLPRCPAEVLTDVAPEAADWREVQQQTFRYCIPSNWLRTPRGWHGDGGVLVAVQSTPERVDKDFPRAYLVASSERSVDRVEIGGRVAEVWDRPAIRRSSDDQHEAYETGALWREPSVYLSGRAQTRAAVQLQKRVFRTVRFAE